MHVIAAKAVAFGEALRPEFKEYQAQVIKNAQALAEPADEGWPRHRHRRHRHPSDAGRPAPPKGVKGNAHRKRPSAAPISPATRTASPSTRKSPRSPRASGWAAPRAPPAASASRSSARSATGSPRWSTALPPMVKTATRRSRPRSAPRSRPFAHASRSIRGSDPPSQAVSPATILQPPAVRGRFVMTAGVLMSGSSRRLPLGNMMNRDRTDARCCSPTRDHPELSRRGRARNPRLHARLDRPRRQAALFSYTATFAAYFFTLWLAVQAWPVWWLVTPLIVVNALAGCASLRAAA